MLGLYLAALCFGGIPILVSLLLGGADKDFDKHLDHGVDHDVDPDVDHDVDHDVDQDVDHDVDQDVEAEGDAEGQSDKDLHGSSDFSLWWLLSMRFWTFGLSAFGLAGTLLTLLSVPALATAVTAVLLGVAIGIGAARFFRALTHDQVSGDTELGRYVGEEGRVLISVRPGQQGKITVSTLAGRVELLATTRDPAVLEVGSRVIVAEVRDGVADVSGLPAPAGDERERLRRAAARKEQDRV
jgi:hypothetical protein